MAQQSQLNRLKQLQSAALSAQEQARHNFLAGVTRQAQLLSARQEGVRTAASGWLADSLDRQDSQPLDYWLDILQELQQHCQVDSSGTQVKQEPEDAAGSAQASGRQQAKQAQQRAKKAKQQPGAEQRPSKRARYAQPPAAAAGLGAAGEQEAEGQQDRSSDADSAYLSAMEDQPPSQQKPSAKQQQKPGGTIRFTTPFHQQHGLRMAVEALRELGSMYVPARALAAGQLLSTVRAFTLWPNSAVARLAARVLQQWRSQLSGCLSVLGEAALLQDPALLLEARIRSGELAMPRAAPKAGDTPRVGGAANTPAGAAAGVLAPAALTGAAAQGDAAASAAAMQPVPATMAAVTPWSAPQGRVLAFDAALDPLGSQLA